MGRKSVAVSRGLLDPRHPRLCTAAEEGRAQKNHADDRVLLRTHGGFKQGQEQPDPTPDEVDENGQRVLRKI